MHLSQKAQRQTAGTPFIHEEEGQLSVDVLETDEEIIVKSTIAGVRPEDLQIQINSDMLTVRGQRFRETESADTRHYVEECYWGQFSRSIILPHHVHPDRAKATLRHGLLTIRMPKSAGEVSLSIEK